MAIKLRGDAWHCDFTAPNGKRIRESLGTADKKQAQELHDKMKAEAWRVNKLGDAPTKTFDEACLRWLDEKAAKKSLDDDKTKIAYFLQRFGGRALSSIKEEDIREAMKTLRNRKHRERWEKMRSRLLKAGKPVPPFEDKPVTLATRNAYLAFMRSLLKLACNEWKWIETVPLIKTPRPRNNRVRWLTHEEANRLIEEMPDSIRPVVVFALATGLRRTNIINLEWGQVDMSRRVAWIHPDQAKGGKAIGIALNDTACKILREQIGKHRSLVFVHAEEKIGPDGKMRKAFRPMRVDDNTGWNAGKKRAGIENFRFHDLRHTWASWLVQAGTPLSIVQEMGGWESIEMVQRYAHLAPAQLTEHACQIDSILGGYGTNTAQKEKGLSAAIA